MMKTSFFRILLIAFSLSSSFLMAQSWVLNEDVSWSAKFRVAYFQPSDEEVKKIYGDGWANYQLEFSKVLRNNFELWTSVDGYKTTGHSVPCCGGEVVSRNKTTLLVVPIALGLKYSLPVPRLEGARVYFGGGASVAFVSIKDHSEFVKDHRSRNGSLGGILKSGVQYVFQNRAFLDVFADYAFQDVHFKDGRHDVDNFKCCLSGLKLGLGLGMYY